MDEDIIQINISNFNLKHTFESAQPIAFFADYNYESNALTYPYMNSILKLEVSYDYNYKSNLSISLLKGSIEGSELKNEVEKRFRLFDDMDKIYSLINTDEYMNDAINQYRGMHLTINDPWEALLCFIISQFNNVKRIRRIVKNLINRYGKSIDGGYKSFPTPLDMEKATKEELMECGSGFRADYILDAIDFSLNNVELDKLNANDYYKLKDVLMEIKGVGEKVADCVVLMGYGNLEAFPIDVWVKRRMEELYFNKEKRSIEELQDFAWDRWGNYRGYAQQYLFHSSRKNTKQ
ncbi:MAG: DNA-3-methyladenine glycosylase 2 [Candidatus Micrarchaeia archaeon]